MAKYPTTMDERLGLNPGEARELKLGSTFSSHHNAFHTLKYDFKPASVDLNKEATVEVGQNHQVQVTVPHLDGSGVPKTVFKGNQKKYTKECVIIIDKNTGEIVVERLSGNLAVKKTRSETGLKPNGQMSSNIGASSSAAGSSNAGPAMKINENSTQRTVSKTKVSTGVRKKNGITGFVHKNSPNQLSDYPHHKSPQSAPAWNANNGQSTLPSIPMIVDDDVEPMGMQPQLHSSSSSSNNNHHHQSHHHHQPQPQMPTAQSMPQVNANPVAVSTELMSSSDSSSDSYSSDSDSSQHSEPARPNVNNSAKPPVMNILNDDLCLSDDDSD